MNFLFVYLHPSEEIHNKKTTIHLHPSEEIHNKKTTIH